MKVGVMKEGVMMKMRVMEEGVMMRVMKEGMMMKMRVMEGVMQMMKVVMMKAELTRENHPVAAAALSQVTVKVVVVLLVVTQVAVALMTACLSLVVTCNSPGVRVVNNSRIPRCPTQGRVEKIALLTQGWS